MAIPSLSHASQSFSKIKFFWDVTSCSIRISDEAATSIFKAEKWNTKAAKFLQHTGAIVIAQTVWHHIPEDLNSVIYYDSQFLISKNSFSTENTIHQSPC
jgi:hypothetical protein